MTKKERETAIEALRADADGEQPGMQLSNFCVETDHGREVANLYWEAFWAVEDKIGVHMYVASLEAAALLEDGWNPGDPVERIGGDQ